MTAYIITGLFFIAIYALGYAKGRIDGRKEQDNKAMKFVSNYKGDEK
ncbi:TPA: hypothetical protein RQN22_001828 [Aeromonas dhakensis]|nr:hypothetical protein [Aeromonas dhakensis]